MPKESCARYQNLLRNLNRQDVLDVSKCLKSHKRKSCIECPDYPPEWDTEAICWWIDNNSSLE